MIVTFHQKILLERKQMLNIMDQSQSSWSKTLIWRNMISQRNILSQKKRNKCSSVGAKRMVNTFLFLIIIFSYSRFKNFRFLSRSFNHFLLFIQEFKSDPFTAIIWIGWIEYFHFISGCCNHKRFVKRNCVLHFQMRWKTTQLYSRICLEQSQ